MFNRKLMCTVLVLIACLCVSVQAAVDLQYLGAFRSGSFWDGQLSLAYNPNGNNGSGSLYVSGYGGKIGEIGIPTPLISSTYIALPTAPLLRSATTSPGYDVQSLAYVQDASGTKLVYGAHAKGYGFSDTNVSNVQGPWTFSGINNNRVGHYMTTIDASWATTNTGGRYMGTGWNYFSYGPGPSFYAFDPSLASPLAAGALVANTKLLEYTTAHNVNDFNTADTWEGSAWIKAGSESALLIGGNKKMPDGTMQASILFYDPADLAAVAAGTKQAWEPQPYRMLSVQANMLAGAAGSPIRDMTYDSVNNILYTSEYTGSGQVFHAWQVTPEPTTLALLVASGLLLLRRRHA
jgi:hypothetical protein